MATSRINALAATATAPANDDYLAIDGTANNTRKILGSKFVSAPSSTDNAIARYDGSAGQIQDSGVLIDDSDNIDVPGNVVVEGALDISGATITGGTGTGTVVREVAPTMQGAWLFSENAALQLDSALSADGKYCGIIEAGTAGTTLAFGDSIYLAVADSRWELTDADADATAGAVKIGVCVLAAAADGDPTTILLWGKIRADAAFPTFTVGAPVYLSTTAGDYQTSQPSGTDDVIRIAGYGNTADEMFFCPSPDYMTHT